jgi:hypothetical protein
VYCSNQEYKKLRLFILLKVHIYTTCMVVWHLLRSATLQLDRFVWKWSSMGRYSVFSTYRAFFVGSTRFLGARELWRTKAPPRMKLFFWLALHRRLWTSERRKRHGLQDDDTCALCDQAAETRSHLFIGCMFSRQVWFKLLEPLQLTALVPDVTMNSANGGLNRGVASTKRPNHCSTASYF